MTPIVEGGANEPAFEARTGQQSQRELPQLFAFVYNTRDNFSSIPFCFSPLFRKQMLNLLGNIQELTSHYHEPYINLTSNNRTKNHGFWNRAEQTGVAELLGQSWRVGVANLTRFLPFSYQFYSHAVKVLPSFLASNWPSRCYFC